MYQIILKEIKEKKYYFVNPNEIGRVDDLKYYHYHQIVSHPDREMFLMGKSQIFMFPKSRLG